MNIGHDTLKEGNCYVFNTAEDIIKNYGFVVINIIKQEGNNYIECALVDLQKEGTLSLSDFQKGSLYTHQVFNPKGNKLGILVYEFHENGFDVFAKFKYVGQLQIDRSKFIIGTGTDAFPEPMFSKTIKHVGVVCSNLNRTPLEKILAH